MGNSGSHQQELTKRAQLHSNQQLEAQRIENEKLKQQEEIKFRQKQAEMLAEQQRLEAANAHKEAMEELANKRREIESAHEAAMNTIDNDRKKIEGEIAIRTKQVENELEVIKSNFNIKMKEIQSQDEATKMINDTLRELLMRDMISPPDFAYLAVSYSAAIRGTKMDTEALDAIAGHKRAENAIQSAETQAAIEGTETKELTPA